MPKGMPIKSEINVALPEILRESQVICHTSASKPMTSSMALIIPCQINSTLSSQLFFLLSSHGDEQRLAEFFHTEAANHALCLRRDHEIGEGLATGGIDPWPVGGIDFEN